MGLADLIQDVRELQSPYNLDRVNFARFDDNHDLVAACPVTVLALDKGLLQVTDIGLLLNGTAAVDRLTAYYNVPRRKIERVYMLWDHLTGDYRESSLPALADALEAENV